MKVITNDGDKFEAVDCNQLVEKLHDNSLAQAVDDRTWMKETAHRVKVQFDREVRDDTTAHFVADLLTIGLLREVEEN
jgi:hypothetical protein